VKKITSIHDLTNKKIVQDGCMITVSGILVDLFNPTSDMILIEDIAHGLANTCRWNGHTQMFWSVAQHCCWMYDLAPPGERFKYLFHDAEEAYWGDMIRPLKNMIKQKYPEIIDLMGLMRNMIYDKFEIEHIDQRVRDKDFDLLKWEFESIITNQIYPIADFMLPGRAKHEWLKRYENGKST